MQQNSSMLRAMAKEQIGGHVDAVSTWRHRAGAIKRHGHRTVRRTA